MSDNDTRKKGGERTTGVERTTKRHGTLVAGEEAQKIEAEPDHATASDKGEARPEGSGNGTVVAGDEAHEIEGEEDGRG